MAQVNQFVKDEKALKEFNILERGKNISGGQRQRVCVSRALYKNYSMLIVDEATSALNREMSDEILHKINENIIENKKILLMISHDEKAASICNKVLKLTA